MTRILAIGGGEIRAAETEPLDAYACERTGSDRPAALFVPTASRDAAGYCDAFDAYYGDRLGCETRHLTLHDGSADSTSARAQLDWADLVYVGGGSLPLLLDTWRETGVDRLLREAWRGGTVVVGLSAGAMCWFADGLSDSTDDSAYSSVECLGWVDLACTPHATPERREAFRESLGRGRAGLALEDGAAVELADGEYRIHSVTGEETAYLYRRGDDGVEVAELDERDEFRPVEALP